MAKIRDSTKRAVKKKSGKGRSTKWTADKKGVSVTWPSLPFGEGHGWIGLFVCAIWTMSLYLGKKDFGSYLIWISLGAGASIFIIVSHALRESFSISEACKRSRIPGFDSSQASRQSRWISFSLELSSTMKAA